VFVEQVQNIGLSIEFTLYLAIRIRNRRKMLTTPMENNIAKTLAMNKILAYLILPGP